MSRRDRVTRGEVADYVVVGSGSSGSVVSARLSEPRQHSVVLLEAGGSDRTLSITVPGLSQLVTYGNPRFDWAYRSEPDPTRNGKVDFMPRGKVMGGTSSINGMSFIRGSKEDFDLWAALGNKGWDFESVLPYFKKSETYEGGANRYRGGEGPQFVSFIRHKHRLSELFIEACVRHGMRRLSDINDPARDGVGYNQVSQRNGSRYSSSRSYLWTADNRRNLDIRQNAHATNIKVEGRRAVGVHYIHGESKKYVAARKAVVLSAGTFNSPQLLMLSGVGPARALADFGIDVVHDLPGVGQNLQDHAGTSVVKWVNIPTFNDRMSLMHRAIIGAQWFFTRRGIASSPYAQVIGYLNNDSDDVVSRMQILYTPAGYELGERGPQLYEGSAVTGIINVHRPYSSGYVSLRSTDPFAQPLIQPNLFSDERDLKTLVRGIRLARRIFDSPPLSSHVTGEFKPGAEIDSDSELEDFVRATSLGVYHPAGTCKMGIDDRAVVDPEMKVYGTDGLYVCDASIMPFVVSANLSANCIMFGEKLSDALLRKEAQ